MTKPADSARSAAISIIAELRQQGHTAYLAGGCVRDALLGQVPKDYDVATDATPDRVQELFPKSAAVGAAFGVVLVYHSATQGRPRWATEVATFRAEGTYSDGRRPDEVRFTTAEEDAQRRDFTVNGLFAEPADQDADPQADRIIDFVGGREDLKAKRIRAIGDPGDRFGEDYLRMLRAVRFAARLGFEIDPKTSAAIRAHARYLGQISRERIGQELLAMLKGPDPTRAIRLLQEHKLDGPTLKEDPSDCELAISSKLSEEAEPATRLCAWLMDRHGQNNPHARVVTRWRNALLLSNDLRDAMNRVLKLIEKLGEWDALGVAKKKRHMNNPQWTQAMLLLEATGGPAAQRRAEAEAFANDGVGLSPSALLAGEDLIAIGLPPGPAFKTLLDQAYDAQLEGKMTDRDQALAWLKEAAKQ